MRKCNNVFALWFLAWICWSIPCFGDTVEWRNGMEGVGRLPATTGRLGK